MRRRLISLVISAAALVTAWVVLDRASTLVLSGDEDENDMVESGCGYEYDHQVRVLDEETGQWECTRCGAEGWDEE